MIKRPAGIVSKNDILTTNNFFIFLQLSILPAEAQNIIEQKTDYLLLHDSLTTGNLEEIHLSALNVWKFSPHLESQPGDGTRFIVRLNQAQQAFVFGSKINSNTGEK